MGERNRDGEADRLRRRRERLSRRSRGAVRRHVSGRSGVRHVERQSVSGGRVRVCVRLGRMAKHRRGLSGGESHPDTKGAQATAIVYTPRRSRPSAHTTAALAAIARTSRVLIIEHPTSHERMFARGGWLRAAARGGQATLTLTPRACVAPPCPRVSDLEAWARNDPCHGTRCTRVPCMSAPAASPGIVVSPASRRRCCERKSLP